MEKIKLFFMGMCGNIAPCGEQLKQPKYLYGGFGEII